MPTDRNRCAGDIGIKGVNDSSGSYAVIPSQRLAIEALHPICKPSHHYSLCTHPPAFRNPTPAIATPQPGIATPP